MDPLWRALSKQRRGRVEECIELCNVRLDEIPNDQAFWALKCRAVIKESYIDDIELDEDGVADTLLDDNAIASVPRPGTSITKANTSSSSFNNNNGSGSLDQSLRPVTQSGRPSSGFVRPNSATNRPMSGQSGDIRSALQSSSHRTSSGTTRPLTNLGREVRLGTASMNHSRTGPLVDSSKINIKKYAKRSGIAMQLVDYLLYVERNPRKALELCAEATLQHDFKEWWWKARLGKCYAKLGLLREAEKQFKSALKDQPIIDTFLELSNIYLRLDLPNSALDVLYEGNEKFTLEPRLLLGMARIYEMLNNLDKANKSFKSVLVLDASNVEAIACLGANYFYSDQPEMASRYYRRLLQMGISTPELWNNIGLCCLYASQYDMALSCLLRAFDGANDNELEDIWYNIGQVGILIGDLNLAYQAFKITISINGTHMEALNNLAVLEIRRKKIDQGRNYLNMAEDNSHIFESNYNLAVLNYQTGNFQGSYNCAKTAIELNPLHQESIELLNKLESILI